MLKLLRAGFFRLKKDSIFWLFLFLTIGAALFTLANSYFGTSEVTIDSLVNRYIMYAGLLIAIFVSIFVGKEYSEGIIRNKIIVGHSRISIYISKLIICITATLLCEFVYIIIVLLIGIPLFGTLQMPMAQFWMSILNTVLIIIAFCSIYHFIAMICKEITVSTTISIVLFIAMFIAQSSFGLTASRDEYITHTSYTEDGTRYIVNKEPDPNYPGEAKVKTARAIYLFIPEGQAMEIGINDAEYLYQMPKYSVTLIIVINALGMCLFSKKELK